MISSTPPAPEPHPQPHPSSSPPPSAQRLRARANLHRLRRHATDALLWLLAATLLLWLGDWAVWRIRVRYGGGYDSVSVSQFLLTPLKNRRVIADEQSMTDQPCTRSLFPHGGDDPCWWLRRHATGFQSATLVPSAVRWPGSQLGSQY